MSVDPANPVSVTSTGRPTRLARWWPFVVGLIGCICVPTMVLFVQETELVVIERFGRIVAVYDRPDQRGLQFKGPWPIDTVRRFDRRLQLLSPAGREAFTRDRKNVTVEACVVWKLADGDSAALLDRPAVRFFRSLGTTAVAEARLSSRLQSILTERMGRCELSELLTATDSESAPPAGTGRLTELADDIKRELIQRSDEQSSLKERQGIEIVDVRIRRLNLPAGNMQAVYERMRSERQKIAERYRSAGLAENRMIRSQADRQAGELLAQADAEAERIRGEGEAAAIGILNAAHARDPEFAALLQTLDSYRQIVNERTTMVLSASNSLLKLLVEGVPDAPKPASGASPSALIPSNGAAVPASGAPVEKSAPNVIPVNGDTANGNSANKESGP